MDHQTAKGWVEVVLAGLLVLGMTKFACLGKTAGAVHEEICMLRAA